jgi:ankyrin repeat protein
MGLVDRVKKKVGSHREKRVERGSPGSSVKLEQISTSAPVSAAVPTKLPPEQAGPSDPQSPSRSQSTAYPSTTTLSIRPADQPSVSATAATSKSPDVWKLAYDKFRAEGPQELLVGYNTHVLGSAAVDTDLSSRESIETALDKLLKDRENRQWKVSILGRDVNIRAQVVRLTKILEWSDPLVKSAVSTQPYAALAWSGVSLLLPLLTSGTTENEAMLEGFSSIGELQQFWQIQEKTSLQSKHQHHYQSLTERLVKLYSLFFTYQAYVICHLSKSQFSRAWGDLSSPGFWKSKAEEIDSWSENCSRLIGVSRESEIQENRDSLLQGIQNLRESNERHIRDEQETRLLGDLAEAAGDYERYKDLNPKRVPGTCEWFLKDERFCKWRDNATSSLLWVSAGPGRGKSVLSKCLIDEDQLATTTITITPSSNKPATSRQSTICYFFFKDGGDGPMDSAQALCALLHQLFTCPSTSRLIKYALGSYKSNERTLTKKASELWKILLACATSPDSGEIICVLDALDECKSESGQELIKTLEEFYSQSTRQLADDSKLKFLVTSRPYDNLESSFGKFPKAVYLRFDGDDKSKEIQKEIDLVIDDRVSDITSDFADEDQQKIAEHLKSMEHRTYLWLHLTFDIIKKSPSEYGRALDIETLLSSLPSQVSEAYEKILSRSTNQSRTKIILQIILAATRPLTLDEANIALVLAIRKEEPESHAELKSELWSAGKFQSVVMNLCGVFVSVYDSKLSFIHQMAREFLLDSELAGTWKGRFNMAQSHHSLSKSCIFYLLLPDIDGSMIFRSSTQFPFLDYAAEAWPSHFVSQNAADSNALRTQARTLCTTTTGQAGTWTPYYSRQNLLDLGGLSDLALASCIGLREVVEDILLKERPDVNSEAMDYRNPTPLSLAAAQGHEAIVKLLLENGAEIEAKDKYGQTALSQACRGGHEAVIKLLLKNEADIEAKDKYGQTPLSQTAEEGHEAIVKLLLEKGVDIEAKDKYGQTPLSIAVQHKNEAIIKLLLEEGVDIESQDDSGYTPLSVAIKEGHEAIVKLLLKEGANIEVEGDQGQTLLLLAAMEA